MCKGGWRRPRHNAARGMWNPAPSHAGAGGTGQPRTACGEFWDLAPVTAQEAIRAHRAGFRDGVE